MHTPTVKQFNNVIEKFDSVIKKHRQEVIVDMNNCGVEPGCNTPMCHGGWYAVASLPKGMPSQVYQSIDYEVGAVLIAKDLGFDSNDHLKAWAFDNQDWWGNACGYYMFCDVYAFLPEDHDGSRQLSLITIRNWWVDVRERCHPRAKKINHKRDIV